MFIRLSLGIILIYFLFTGFNSRVYVAPENTLTQTNSENMEEKNLATTTEKVATTTEIKTTQSATTTPKKQIVVAKKVEAPVKTEPAPTQPAFVPDFEAINTFTRKSIVNILCSSKGGELSPISGTGIVIDSRGTILTNAHLAQYLLLKDYSQKDFIECIVRTGSPAYPKYRLELVYISPNWVSQNKALLKDENPTGTGENDFAFLRITKTIDGSALPTEFSYLPLNIRETISVGEPALLASYPAGFLGGLSVLQDLSITTAIAIVNELFTFSSNTIDLISVPGTVVSQKGSSGGAVVDGFGTLIGTIVTSTNGNSTSDRDLRAITLAYINRSLQKELGANLVQFIEQDLSAFAKKFQEINAPALTKLITDELLK